LDRNPCGSSSGSAVAVAARLAPLAIGTETDGSIVCPAGANGVVGIKPASGFVSRLGIVPIARSQDTAGALARTVADAALLLSVLAEPEALPLTFAKLDVAGLRVGVVRNHPGAGRDADVDVALGHALRWLEDAGVELVDPVDADFSAATRDAELTVLLSEFREDLGGYLARVEQGPRTLDELVAFNQARAADVMPHFGQELLLAARDGRGTEGADYAAAKGLIDMARSTLAALFTAHRLDALVAPTNGRAWRTNHGAGDVFGVGSSRIAAVSGYPSVTVPVRLARELPLGVSLIGKPGAEAQMLALGEALERARGPFPEPRFLSSID
jgi:amidase